jgi:hypothetical protein
VIFNVLTWIAALGIYFGLALFLCWLYDQVQRDTRAVKASEQTLWASQHRRFLQDWDRHSLMMSYHATLGDIERIAKLGR